MISEKPDFNFPRLPLWTFAAFIFGDLKFSLPNINKPEFENLKKNIINKIREQTFTDLIFNLSDSPPKLSIFEEFAKNENEISQQIRKLNEILMKKPIWKDVFSFSLIGNIRKSKEKIITTIETFEIPDPKQIYDLLEKKASDVLNLGNYIPSRKITSGIHALFSHDTKRKYEPNDFEDILHSCLALPYFDIFFTDKKNAKILTSDLLSFHTVYNCKIEYNIESCLNILESV